MLADVVSSLQREEEALMFDLLVVLLCGVTFIVAFAASLDDTRRMPLWIMCVATLGLAVGLIRVMSVGP